MKLKGRYAIITGAGQGLGASIAEHYAAAGASMYLCGRNLDKLESLQKKLSLSLVDGQRILISRCDVAIPAEVDALVSQAIAAFSRIDILVNNAGVYGPFGAIEEINWQEWVEAITINLMGTVYPSRAVVPHMRKQGYGKIINLSGGGATNPLPRVSAYAAAKAAVVRFGETLALELASHKIDVNSVAPGALNTHMMDQLIAAGPERVGEAFFQRMLKIKQEGGTPLETGAKLCVWLASSASDGITGRLISAVWDKWEEMPQHLDDLNTSDIYTLRRIVPKDRGKDWGG